MEGRAAKLLRLGIEAAANNNEGSYSVAGVSSSWSGIKFYKNTEQPCYDEIPAEKVIIEAENELTTVLDNNYYCLGNSENFVNNDDNTKNTDTLDDPVDPYATDNGGSDYDPTDDLLDLAEAQETDEELQPEEDEPVENVEENNDTTGAKNSDIGNKKTRKALTRKKVRNVSSWRRNVIQKSRNAGQPYKSWKEKDVAGRKLKAPCGEKCRLKCSSKLNEEARMVIFKDYWKLQDVNRQRDFIFRYVDFKQKATERRRVEKQEQGDDNESESRRRLTFSYHMPGAESSEKIKVCQTFFLNTLSISHQVVKTVANKIQSGNSTIQSDMRGRVQCNSRLPEEVKQSLRNHIALFQPIESHYCRKDTSKTYLPSSLNVKRMYDLYKTYCSENNLKLATESIYRQDFCQEYNISFFVPKKDQCGVCTRYTNCNDIEKLEMQPQIDLHLLNKNLARESKNKDKERAKVDETFCAAVFDLQQVLPCPKIEVGEAYYKRKLSSYNFTVYDLGKNECFCYMWHEVIAGRGACEIGSCLHLFLTNKINSGVTEFSLYSDNCAGQNHNRFVYQIFFG